MIDIEHIESLAALRLEGEEKERIRRDLEEIISYFEVLNEVDTEGIEPLVFTKEVCLFLRKDEVKVSLNRQLIEKNRQLFGDGFFRVKRIIGE
jgi:aspartyl-tRNA(Asn)/glutamyl-tRNA(Gln) amidotransferase subunit C